MKIIGLLFVAVITAMGQGMVNQTAGPPPDNFVDQFFLFRHKPAVRDCRAASLQPPHHVLRLVLPRSPVSQCPPTSGRSRSRGLPFYGYRIRDDHRTVAGSATTALNGTYLASRPSIGIYLQDHCDVGGF